jgi:hypothetical protein
VVRFMSHDLRPPSYVYDWRDARRENPKQVLRLNVWTLWTKTSRLASHGSQVAEGRSHCWSRNSTRFSRQKWGNHMLILHDLVCLFCTIYIYVKISDIFFIIRNCQKPSFFFYESTHLLKQFF